MLDPREAFLNALLRARQKPGSDPVFAKSGSGTGFGATGTAPAFGAGPGTGPASAEALLAQLRDTELGEWLAGERWQDAAGRDRALWSAYAALVGGLAAQAFVPPEARRFMRAWLLKFDLFNLKATLQRFALDKPHDSAATPSAATPSAATPANPLARTLLPVGTLHAAGQLEALAETTEMPALRELLRRTGLGLFVGPLRDFNPAAGPRARLAAEADLESAYQRELRHVARRMKGGQVLAAGCGLMTDFANLGILCRLLAISRAASGNAAHAPSSAAQHFIPGGALLSHHHLQDALAHSLSELPRRLDHELHRKAAAEAIEACERTGSLATLDNVLERHRLEALRALFAPQLAPAVVLTWFLVVKEIELRNIRLALAAAEDGVGCEEIRRELVA